MVNTYFLNFIEEMIQNLKYSGYIGGRIEIIPEYDKKTYPIDEIRFFTDRVEEFNDFRERYDFQSVSETELKALYLFVTEEFNEKVS